MDFKQKIENRIKKPTDNFCSIANLITFAIAFKRRNLDETRAYSSVG